MIEAQIKSQIRSYLLRHGSNPSMIVINEVTFKDLCKEIAGLLHTGYSQEYTIQKIKYMGINIYRSDDIEPGSVKVG